MTFTLLCKENISLLNTRLKAADKEVMVLERKRGRCCVCTRLSS